MTSHYELVSSVAIIHLKATSTQLPITQHPFYIIQPKLSSVANCPVFNRTVRYFGDLSGLKMKAKPDMHAFVRYINPVILAHAPWFTVAGMRCPVFLNVLSGNPSKACTLYRV